MRSPSDEPGKELLINQNVFEKYHFQNIFWFPSTRKREVGVRDGLVDSGRSGLTVEIKLCFQISPAKHGRGPRRREN